MKRAVTLLELIFVIILISVLSATAIYYFKPNYLRNDANFVYMKLLKTRYQAVGYSKTLSVLGEDFNQSIGCIDLTKESLSNDETKTSSKSYNFKSDISVTPSGLSKICFDQFGKVHTAQIQDDLTKDLQNEPIEIVLSYNNRQKNIKIYPVTGYIEVK